MFNFPFSSSNFSPTTEVHDTIFMKGLFTEVKKAPVKAGAFKFAFKLGGSDDEGADDEIENQTAISKKNKKKKKKKKTLASNNTETSSLNEDASNIEVNMSDLKLSEIDLGGVAVEMDATETESSSKILSKSQKKNLKRSKAKKSDNVSYSGEGIATVEGKETGHTSSPSKSATGIKETKSPKKGKAQSKNVTTSKVVEEEDDWEQELNKAIRENAAQQAKQKPGSGPVKKNSGVYIPPTGHGPHFLSAKDPELDEASRQRYRFGMGRNLVAIGPAKVRDPNWLLPPPGLTRTTQQDSSARPLTLSTHAAHSDRYAMRLAKSSTHA